MQAVDNAVVHEAIGANIRPIPAGAVIVFGMISLMIVGVAPSLLGALVDEHRLPQWGLGVSAMVELFSMGLATGLAGAFLKPERLRAIGAGASIALAAINLSTMHAANEAVYLMRALAGVPEGLLLWITIGMIARTVTPERWAAVFFSARVLSEMSLAWLYAAFVIRRYGADGGFAALALFCLIGVPAAFLAPDRYGRLTQAEGVGGPLPIRGVLALIATVVFISANGAVAVYLQPLAHRAGLNADVARTAVWASLGAQIVGGVASAFLAGRVRYLPVFAVTVATFLGVWLVFGLGPPAWLFIMANCVSGIIALLVGPFMVPMIIEADPTRRSAMQSGGAQLFGGATGPLIAALAIGNRDVIGVLWLGAGLLLTGFAMVAWLSLTTRPVETAS